MKIFEIEPTSPQFANLITVLNFLRQRAHMEKLVGRISFKSLSTMLSNTGSTIDYSSFKHYYDNPDNIESYDALKGIIKSFDRDSITLEPFGDEEDQIDQSNPDNSDQPSLNKVDTMAKRALRKRS